MPRPVTSVSQLVRLQIKISRDVAEALKGLSDKHGTTVTQEVRRAVSLWKYLDDAHTSGDTLLLAKDGRYREIVLDVLTGK